MERNCRAIAVLSIFSASLLAQSPKLEFEVASVRAAATDQAWGDEAPKGGPGTSDPTRVRFSRVPLIDILMTAFDVDRERIVAPEWTANFREPDGHGGVTTHDTAARYDIVATMPPGTTKAQSNEMLKNLLIDRFKLTYHVQKKEFDVHKATIAASGSKLKPAAAAGTDAPVGPEAPVTWGLTVVEIPKSPDGFPDLPAGRPAMVGIFAEGGQKIRVTARMQPVASLLRVLNGVYVVDDTGLTGTYDFKLEYQLAGLALVAAKDFAGSGITGNFVTHTTRTEMFPGLIAAVEKQLGLKLEKAKTPLDVVVIDHIEKVPTDN
jgi:uncharacterized protein (TIGR03435 family)